MSSSIAPVRSASHSGRTAVPEDPNWLFETVIVGSSVALPTSSANVNTSGSGPEHATAAASMTQQGLLDEVG